jgi:hypothetical protein
MNSLKESRCWRTRPLSLKKAFSSMFVFSFEISVNFNRSPAFSDLRLELWCCVVRVFSNL